MHENKQNQPERPSTPPKFIPKTPRGPASVSHDTSHSVQRTSGLAVTSLILAILGITAPIALVLGIVALVKINRNRDTLTGSGLAIAGIVVSGSIAFVMIIIYAVLFPVLDHARDKAAQASCQSNLKMQALAMQMYCQDYDGRFPDVRRWNDAIDPYIKSPKILVCTRADDRTLPSYAANFQIQSRVIHKLKAPADTIMLFDSTPARNNFGGPNAPEYRHSDGCNFAFADGHTKWVSREKAKTLSWWPE